MESLPKSVNTSFGIDSARSMGFLKPARVAGGFLFTCGSTWCVRLATTMRISTRPLFLALSLTNLVLSTRSHWKRWRNSSSVAFPVERGWGLEHLPRALLSHDASGLTGGDAYAFHQGRDADLLRAGTPRLLPYSLECLDTKNSICTQESPAYVEVPHRKVLEANLPKSHAPLELLALHGGVGPRASPPGPAPSP